ncbi:MAG TPA: fructosamine kinase family protein [Actinomycetaceae bacterium]|nr:fructosamine kinase family protein [Actinomycetaceae bacterium]
MTAFRKHGSAAAIASEATSLRWLAGAIDDGGAPVVPLLAVGDGWLETKRLRPSRPSRDEAAEFGRRLAATHAAGAPWWGAPPPDLDPGDSRLAELVQPVFGNPDDAPTTWGELYAEHRVRPYVRMAVDARELSPGQARVVEAALARIAEGEFDTPQPHGCPDVARLHGDLWGGNVLWALTGAGGTQGTLIDPAAYGGHAETDLAELALFGSPHLESTLSGYDDAAPLAPGWRERVPLHQLHMLAVHAALFGGGYGGRLTAAARQYA